MISSTSEARITEKARKSDFNCGLPTALSSAWQTCYRRYRRWQRSGLMDEIYRLLYQDLHDRAGLDLIQALQVEDTITRDINPACGEGTITLSWDENGWLLCLPSGLEGTWQGSTVHLLVQVILARIKQNRRYQFPHKLTITFSG